MRANPLCRMSVLALVALVTGSRADAQTSVSGNDWNSIAALPDLSGSWLYDPHRTQVATGEPVPLTPIFAEKMKKVHALNVAGGDVPARAYHCMPRGVPDVMELITRLYEFLETPGLMTIIPQNNEVRFIYTDGRGHPDHLRASYSGHSIGHWEKDEAGKDMLVIDTIGMPAGIDMFYGFPAGGPMHVVEHLKLLSADKMEVAKTIEDKVTLTAPYTYARTYTRHREWPVLEEICVQNNHDVSATGHQQFAPPPPGLGPFGPQPHNTNKNNNAQ